MDSSLPSRYSKCVMYLKTDKTDNKFYVGEDATIMTQCKKSFNVHRVKWQRDTVNGLQDIDTTLPKYKETRFDTDYEHKLEIKILNCDESDSGTYILVLICQNVAFCEEKIDLKVVQGKSLFKMSYFCSTYNEFERVLIFSVMPQPHIHGLNAG